jgi:hypothetical protein
MSPLQQKAKKDPQPAGQRLEISMSIARAYTKNKIGRITRPQLA